MTLVKYIIDTSSLIELNRHNPMDVYPGVWHNIENLIRQNRLLAPKEVYKEISRKDDILFDWVKNNNKIFVEPTNEQIDIVRELLKKYPSMIRLDRIYDADPWVIAMAIDMAQSKQSTLVKIKKIVVTEEKIRGNQIKIPYVCKTYNIECIDILDMFRKEGWQF